MKYKQVSTSLRRIANKVLTQDDLAKRIIIQKGNTYKAFDRYTIEETPEGWTLSACTFDTPLLFNTAKVALAWCILDKAGQYSSASQMLYLDSRITIKQSDIDVLTYMLENADPLLNRATLLARLSEDINNRQSYKKQLSNFVKQAKYIKLKGTNNEFIRFNKTSRRKHSR